ncbi:hypothetical protein F5884DRAFT_782093 [Xylogone sp. PMI_703]|nr:hypothetical protein F5884DRAFT_782093 [Xylogone sp. PMI_703]
MADHNHEEEIEGAKPSELLIEACRRNNTDLLQEVIDGCKSPEEAAELLNSTKTVLGNYLYHEAALKGHAEIIDMLLDQEGFECDPINVREGDTPLHSVVRWINDQPESEWEYGRHLVDMMIEAGSDPRIRNKAKLTAEQLVDPRNETLRKVLQDALEMQLNEAEMRDLEKEAAKEEEEEAEELGSDYEGSASDSDFDIEEFRRERERLKAQKAAEVAGGSAI